MKRCPSCNSTYTDNSLNFCLQDRTPLVSTPTHRQAAVTETDLYKKKNKSKLWLFLLILIAIITSAIIISKLAFKKPLPTEPQISIDRVDAYLDLTSAWLELNEVQRKTIKSSKAIFHIDSFGVRKFSDIATYERRIGTSSEFTPEWHDDSIHKITAKEDKERKCFPDAKYSYVLATDISMEKINVPFNVSYEIDYWNAHNKEEGDFQSFHVSYPINRLTIKVSFPKNKPYTRFYLKSALGVDCTANDFKDYANPNVQEGTDKETGAKTITWVIDSPKIRWIYEIVWEW